MTARNTDKIKDIVENYPENAIALSLDVTNQESIQNAVKRAVEHFETIDVLVNNAGYGYRSALEEGDMQDVSKLFETNVWGRICFSQVF